MTYRHTHTGYCYTWTIKAGDHTLTDVLTEMETHTHTHTNHCCTWTTNTDQQTDNDLLTDTHTDRPLVDLDQ